jgi:hypothetical protein
LCEVLAGTVRQLIAQRGAAAFEAQTSCLTAEEKTTLQTLVHDFEGGRWGAK